LHHFTFNPNSVDIQAADSTVGGWRSSF